MRAAASADVIVLYRCLCAQDFFRNLLLLAMGTWRFAVTLLKTALGAKKGRPSVTAAL
jgi:hypothetical protein